MLIKEQISTRAIRYFSDSNKYIQRVEDGRLFGERLETIGSKWTYVESQIDMPKKEEEQAI